LLKICYNMSMGKINKITLPITIILTSIILGGFYYASEVNKQKSIERQQLLKLQEDRGVERAKAEVEEIKLEQEKKEYAADRKNDCLNIYKTESDKWNNARGWRYDDINDECYVRYKDPSPKSDAKCDEDYPMGGDWGLVFLRKNSLCKEGEFENSF